MQIGDEVVTMSAAGRFRITAIDGDMLTIENPEGVSKVVLKSNVRVLPPAAKQA